MPQLPSPNTATKTQLLSACCTKVRMLHGCLSVLSFITVVIQAHASWGSEKQSCTKILLRFRMRPAAITLNYSIKNIRNDVRQIVYLCGSPRYKSNIIPLRSLTALSCLKHCSTELLLRVGLIHAT